MHEKFQPPAPPQFGELVPAARPSEEILAFLAQRRSTPAKGLSEPGPSPDQVDALLRIAARVPDHGKLAPWRFLVFEGEARAAAGAVLATAFQARETEADETLVARERGRFLRAPVVIAVVCKPRENHKIPLWEQYLSAGAACQTLLLAGQAMGFAGQWLTEWYAYDPDVLTAFGLRPGERVAGYVYLGAPTEEARERARPSADDLIARWSPR